MGIKIIVEGFNKLGKSTGRATRVLTKARSRDFVLDNVDHLKKSIKIGQCGTHVIELHDGKGTLRREDAGRRGTIAAQTGTFQRVQMIAAE